MSIKPRRSGKKSTAAPIEPAQLRKAIAESQIDHRCTDELAEYLLKVHTIVIKTNSYFRQTTKEEEEEGRSWSLERWLSRGIWLIDLAKWQNPFHYLYAGSYLNMLNRIQRMRNQQLKKERYEKMVKEAFVALFPSMQIKDMSTINDLDQW